MSVLTALLSLAAEALFGYPDRLYRAIGHPVTWLGRLIACLDRRLNRAPIPTAAVVSPASRPC
jgi:adenosylcobinamide-phosphate synthase